MDGKVIAVTIVDQLGGHGLLNTIIGADNFTYSSEEYWVQFDFDMCRKANVVRIALNGSDLYDITFYKVNRKMSAYKETGIFKDVYAEDLKEVFENFTDLVLTFPNIIVISD